jgi:hypothetical protein
MNFKIHNLKLEPWNNSCKFIFLQHHFNVMYTSSPIHLKDDAKQNKDKKETTMNTSKTQLKGEKIYLWVH